MATFLIQGLEDTIGKGVSSWFDNVSEEHGLTEDGKTVPPFFWVSVTKAFRYRRPNIPTSVRFIRPGRRSTFGGGFIRMSQFIFTIPRKRLR